MITLGIGVLDTFNAILIFVISRNYRPQELQCLVNSPVGSAKRASKGKGSIMAATTRPMFSEQSGGGETINGGRQLVNINFCRIAIGDPFNVFARFVNRSRKDCLVRRALLGI